MEPSTQTGGGLNQELTADAQTLKDTAKERLASEMDARKGTASTQAQSLSSALNAAAGELSDSPDWLRSLCQRGAQSLQSFADTIENKDSRALTRDVQQFARENPTMFLAGAAAAGFAAARVLKAGVDSPSSTGANGFQSQPAKRFDPYEPQGNQPTGTAFGGFDDAASTQQPAAYGEV
jgi:hypothetical protein